MITLKLFTYLKNTDLHCVSAYEVISQLLEFKSLKKLRRFGYWEITFDLEDSEKASKYLNRLVKESFEILNPNKEAYFLDKIDTKDTVLHPFRIKVQKDEGQKYQKLAQMLSKQFKFPIKNIEHAKVWELTVDTNGRDIENVQKELEDKIILTTSRNKGVLVNPLFEQFSYLNETI